MNLLKKHLWVMAILPLWILNSEARLLRYSEFQNSFEQATRINTTPTIAFYLNGIASTLPQQGKLRELSDRMVLSQTMLASFYCDEMIKSDSKKPVVDRWAHGKVNFSIDIKSALTPAVLSDVINQYSLIFWRRYIQPHELDIIQTSIQQYITGATALPVSISDALLLGCSAMGGSFDFMWIE